MSLINVNVPLSHLRSKNQISHTSLLVSKNVIITNGVHYSHIPQGVFTVVTCNNATSTVYVCE